MLPFWIANILCWGFVAVYCATGAWAMVIRKGVRRGDPMRFACFLTAVVTMSFSLRWLLAPGAIELWQAITTLSAACALFIVKLARTYGRGPLV